MKTSAVLVILAAIIWVAGCQVAGPSVKIKGPKVKIPGVEIGVQGGGKVCLPDQAKSGRC